MNKKKKREKASLFKNSSVADRKKKELMQEDCIHLATYLQSIHLEKNNNNDMNCTNIERGTIQPGSEAFVNLGLYTTRSDLFKLISTECKLCILFSYFLFHKL